MLAHTQIARGGAALALAALLASGGPAAHAAVATPAEFAFLKLLKRKPPPQAEARPAGPADNAAGADKDADGPIRLNPALTAPLEMPVGRRPQRLLPTRA